MKGLFQGKDNFAFAWNELVTLRITWLSKAQILPCNMDIPLQLARAVWEAWSVSVHLSLPRCHEVVGPQI